MGLPIPFKKYIPKVFHQDPTSDVLAGKVDEHLRQWQKDAVGMARIYRADECPAGLLEYLGDYLEAGIFPYDTELTKRRKIINAVEIHKNRGTWSSDAKQRIDNITSLSPGARILSAAGFYDDAWILTDGDTFYFPAASYCATLGVDGIDNELGIALMGGEEIGVAGNIYIDCHEGITTPVLTADQQARIKNEFLDENQFAYYKLFFGYVNGSGQFVSYFTIE